MATHPGTPVRRGVPKGFTLSPDAVELLRILAPNAKTHGHFISELLRAEMSRREERARVHAELREAMQAVLAK